MPLAVPGPSADAAGASRAAHFPRVAPLVMLLIAAALSLAALSVDVVRTGYGIKGDEATYVAMALSVAHDGDLAFERRDLERFWRIYGSGPEGIFLKRGQHLGFVSKRSFPFFRVDRDPDMAGDRLYFGKAFAYALVAAPFVRLAGLNGLLVFHVLAWTLCVWAGYVFLRARSPAVPAALLSIAFFGLSITPIYLVWLTPEIFHVAAVFLAYFLWFYRTVAVPVDGWWSRFLHGHGSLWVAAVLLGLATFSKPPNLLLVAPPVLLLWQRRQWRAGLLVGLVTGATILVCFGINGLISGDFNYQGGDRKTFYGRFPFESAAVRYDDAGLSMSTNELGADEVRDREGFFDRLALNAGYFVAGRHAGFVPYYFPGVIVLGLWAARRRAWRMWHFALLASVAATVVILLVVLPYSWAGGGGPPGNRYFLSIHPVLLMLTPPLASVWPPVAAWLGGALFLGHVLVNPFVAAKSPWHHVTQGMLGRLPVERTMVNDLPVMLNGGRARVPYGEDPTLLLYFLDDHAFSPEPAGIWIAGASTAEIVIRTGEPIDRFTLTLRTLVRNRVSATAGGERRRAELQPGGTTTLSVPARAVATRGTWAYLLRVSAASGAVPALVDPNARDPRFLGVLMEIRGQRAAPGRP